MKLKSFESYKDALYYCRFCPMCKPAADVANVTNIESHSTRGRAVLLWRIATDKADFTKRDVELLYQSTLDTISESWCINHFPVSEYILSARYEVVKRNLQPKSVKRALELESSVKACPKSETVLLASEAAEVGGENLVVTATKVLSKVGIAASVYQQTNGVLSYVLGDMDQAKAQLVRLLDALKAAGVRQVVTDGPKTYFALTKMAELLEVTIPDNLLVASLTEVLHKHSSKIAIREDNRKVFVHDCKSAFFLGDSMATDEALQPHLNGNEEALGTGTVYSMIRDVVDKAGMTRLFGVWSRSLAKSSGVDDALWITYPEVAQRLALQRLDYAKSLDAEVIVTDSLASAEYLSNIAQEIRGGMEVVWLPQLFL